MGEMKKYILKRIIFGLILIFGISLITMFLIDMVPGNFFDQLRMNPQFSPEQISYLEDKYHLSEPFLVRYFYWIANVLRFDFGISFMYQMPVISLVKSRLFNTFLLSLAALVLAWISGIAAGLFAACNKDGVFDKIVKSAAYLFLSVPGFFLALIFVYVFANTTFLPVGGMHSPELYNASFFVALLDVLRHMIIPVLVLALPAFSYLFRIMRSNVLDILARDFVYVLRARGFSENYILFRHVLPNALNPLISLLGFQLPALFSGAALVEIITGWPGLGSLMLTAVRSQDMFLVMGNIIMLSFLLVIGNLFADLLLLATDPRIRRVHG